MDAWHWVEQQMVTEAAAAAGLSDGASTCVCVRGVAHEEDNRLTCLILSRVYLPSCDCHCHNCSAAHRHIRLHFHRHSGTTPHHDKTRYAAA